MKNLYLYLAVCCFAIAALASAMGRRAQAQQTRAWHAATMAQLDSLRVELQRAGCIR